LRIHGHGGVGARLEASQARCLQQGAVGALAAPCEADVESAARAAVMCAGGQGLVGESTSGPPFLLCAAQWGSKTRASTENASEDKKGDGLCNRDEHCPSSKPQQQMGACTTCLL